MALPYQVAAYTLIGMANKFQEFFYGAADDVTFEYMDETGTIQTITVENVAKLKSGIDSASVTDIELAAALENFYDKVTMDNTIATINSDITTLSNRTTDIENVLPTKANKNGDPLEVFEATPGSTPTSVATKGQMDEKVVGYKNLIINGGLQVDQKGLMDTGVTVDVSGDFNTLALHKGKRTFDTFSVIYNSKGDATAGNFTAIREKIDNKYRVKLTANTGVVGTTYVIRPLLHFIEDKIIEPFIGKEVTLSYTLTAKTNGQYSVTIGYPNDHQFTIFSVNYTGNGTPQRFSHTLTLPTDLFTSVSNGISKAPYIGLEIYFSYAAGSADTRISDDTNLNGVFNAPDTQHTLTRTTDYKWWEVDGEWIAYSDIQLEEGPYATKFDEVPYDLALQRCLRYYEYIDYVLNRAIVSVGYAFPRCDTRFKVQKVYVPSVYLINKNVSSGTVTDNLSASIDRVQTNAYYNNGTISAHYTYSIIAAAEI